VANITNKKPALTDQQEIFLQAYVANGRNVEAAEEVANYSKTYGRTVLQKPHIRQRLAEIMQQAMRKMQVSQAVVLEEIACLAFSDITDLGEVGNIKTMQDMRNLPKSVRHAIHSIDFKDGIISKIRMHPKIQSLSVLAEATELVKTERERDADRRPAFTGLTMITSKESSHD
jgi:Terminase small subunit